MNLLEEEEADQEVAKVDQEEFQEEDLQQPGDLGAEEEADLGIMILINMKLLLNQKRTIINNNTMKCLN